MCESLKVLTYPDKMFCGLSVVMQWVMSNAEHENVDSFKDKCKDLPQIYCSLELCWRLLGGS